MTKEELVKKYPLLNHKDFALAKASISRLMGQDKDKDLTDDRAFMTTFFDSKSESNGDTFFWEMLRFLRFILEGATAYTTPDGIISLNVPCEDIIPQDKDRVRRWYFVYCHECLHQLWNTFAVGDKIKAELGECDHQLLNIASDCVINDYLSEVNNANKLPPTEGIYPKVIEEKYGIKFNRSKDTQYTLYMKLKALSDQQQQDIKDQFGDDDQQQGGGQQGGGQQGGGQQGGGQQGGGSGDGGQQGGDNQKSKTPEEASDKLKDSAESAAKQAQDIADKLSANKDKNASAAQEAADKAKEAADKAKEAADKAKECAKNGDTKGTIENLKKAIEETRKANEALKEAQSLDSSNKSDKNGNGDGDGSGEGDKKDGKEKSNGSGNGDEEDSEDDASRGDDSDSNGKSGKGKGDEKSELEKAMEEADNAAKEGKADKSGKSGKGQNSKDGGEGAGNGDDEIEAKIMGELKGEPAKIIKKYSDSLSGSLGQFVKQCQMSKKMNKNGLAVESHKGSTDWNKQVPAIAKKYVHQKLQNKKRYRSTYNRIRRGEAAFGRGDMGKRIINPGREEVRTKLGFDIGLYVDISGSMGDTNLSKVFDASYAILADLKASFGKEPMVDKNQIDLHSYVFTTRMKEIKYGTKVRCEGSTYEFDKLLSDIHKNGQDAFLNIIITDGDFASIDNAGVAKVLETMEGLIILVTNKSQGYFDKLVKHTNVKTPNKLVAVYADANWTLQK